MPFFKVGLAELKLDSSELALKNPYEEVSAAARRLQEAGVNALSLALHEVKHGFDHPRGGEYLSVVGNALFRLHQAHEQMQAEHSLSLRGRQLRMRLAALHIFSVAAQSRSSRVFDAESFSADAIQSIIFLFF